MSIWSRFRNVFRPERMLGDIDEELRGHMEEGIEQGRDPAEVRRAFGSPLRIRDESSDFRMLPWLDSLRADVVVGWRQIHKRKVTSAVAIVSLALALGACIAAFRLIDALLLRPLPVANPERLYALFSSGAGHDGKTQPAFDFFSFPMFRQMRTAVKGQAELIALTAADATELTFGSYQDTEEPFVQYVSGVMFPSFGLRPAYGRLLMQDDDLKNAHPSAVLSHDYWTRRFGQDPNVIGRTFRLQGKLFEIVGVGPVGFTGTEPGTETDIFLPTNMYPYPMEATNGGFIRILAVLRQGLSVEPVGERLRATFLSIDHPFKGDRLLLEPAAAGVSDRQDFYRVSLIALGALVGLMLLVACANVANLMTAQASTREHEMAVRVSMGAGRGRLVQLVLVESAMIAFAAALAGGLFAWRSTPLIVDMLKPARLFLPLDWRVFGFAAVLTTFVTLLFGLAPALRASATKPSGSLRGSNQVQSQRRWMHTLVTFQAAFCCLIVFVASLFVGTLDRLVHRPVGFSAERILILHAISERPQPPALWDQVAQHLRQAAGVESVGLADWPLLQGSSWIAPYVSINGALPSQDRTYRLHVSPGWANAIKTSFLDGRDFLGSDIYPGAAIVNEAFAKRYFGGENPIGKIFEIVEYDGTHERSQVVGVVRDARYRDIREQFTPTVFVPFHEVDAKGQLVSRRGATIFVRTSGPRPLALASILTDEILHVNPELRVNRVQTQQAILDGHTVRERLLALLARFFALVALLLAGIGLYGVLDYTVVQRRREIGIRMALGARASHVARGVTIDVFMMVLIGAAAGIGIGLGSARYIASLLFEVKATDGTMLVLPMVTILATALAAGLPAVVRAVRIDPAVTLRAE